MSEPAPKEPTFTDAEIDALVETFYAKVRRHPRIGPVFNGQIAEEAWPHHMAMLKDFWATVLQGSGRYKGSPMAVHQRIEGFQEWMFTPWLNLFHATCVELFDAPRAAIIGEKAERIARSLKLGLFFRPGAPA
ncbi:group III truncated hemoglobin [Caulobacter endophyticus]|uniref:Preprotein translocase subunit TatC n=1 Tax=Caulobacter endophyticus TaxID=2172652 RepID=A0A2T9JIS9_9CAUL|nr:group III truncated hemoglobin [Caulobacter endophyticus]PVM83605.1 preprotein translocase subunit TatC [Caulobacter endophyticus]